MIVLDILRALRKARRLDDPDMAAMRARAAASVKACLDEEEAKW